MTAKGKKRGQLIAVAVLLAVMIGYCANTHMTISAKMREFRQVMPLENGAAATARYTLPPGRYRIVYSADPETPRPVPAGTVATVIGYGDGTRSESRESRVIFELREPGRVVVEAVRLEPGDGEVFQFLDFIEVAPPRLSKSTPFLRWVYPSHHVRGEE